MIARLNQSAIVDESEKMRNASQEKTKNTLPSTLVPIAK
jgi:hypothetical protein